mgnify:CR=1 FL=1
MHIGAQPVPPSLIKHWKEYFPNHLYDTNYGLSESTGPGCVHLGIENIDKLVQLAFQVTAGPARLSMRMEMHFHREKSESFVYRVRE